MLRKTCGCALVVMCGASFLIAADKKKDPDSIGDRDVGKGMNFYSGAPRLAPSVYRAQFPLIALEPDIGHTPRGRGGENEVPRGADCLRRELMQRAVKR